MPLQPGSKIGAYEVIALLGAGGMGEVYRAWDARLNREVAIKIVNARYEGDPEGLRRFELEARSLAALSHPNLLAIYDIGDHEGTPYIVSELLEGETLRIRLAQGVIPLRRAIDFGTQIVRALVAAHEKGLVHRDLKPDNVFLTRDGQVKLLDFGLAKLVHQKAAAGSMHTGVTTITIETGKVLGTPGYMSPEQLRGQTVDYRSDIFAFGAVLHEMISGKRAFPGSTTADLVSATLNTEPQDLSETNPAIPYSTTLIIRHCLEKRADDRFQSARDLLFDLETLAVSSGSSGSGSTAARRAPRQRSSKGLWLWWAVAAIAAAAAAFFAGRLLVPAIPEPPSFTQVTFRRSTISYARFTADGNTVLYNASWAQQPIDIFSTRLGSTESRALGITNADLLAVSSKGELAVLIDRQGHDPWFGRGTLARVPMGGGSPREIMEDVQSADWSPNGDDLAVAREVNNQQQLEYPLGKMLYHTSGWITDVRVSPAGDRVAYMEHGTRDDDRGWISTVDLNGKVQRLTTEFASERGLAWSPDGREVWFTATQAGEPLALYAISLRGKMRVKSRAPISLLLHDISQDGSALIASHKELTSVVFLPAGESTERDLSWLDQIHLFDLSADGKTFLFQYYGQGSGANYSSYLGKTDGSPPVRLGDGAAVVLSPDGKWAVTILYAAHQTVLLPTGPGQVRPLDRQGVQDRGENSWAPDNRHVLFTGAEEGHAPRCYIQDITGGKPQPLCPEGVTHALMSPDGKFMFARKNRRAVLLSSDGSGERPLDGIAANESVLRWSGDSQSLYVYAAHQPVQLYRVSVFTGRRELVREINLADPAGIIGFPQLFVAEDGQSLVYSFVRKISELYVVKDLPK